MITKNSIENLKTKIDIVDVISNYIVLKKTGANFKAPCPFHNEKTPSFVVSPSKQIFHCFGCGIGGDAIKFVMEYEKLSYPEAIKKLAKDYNIFLEYDDNESDIDILDKVNSFFISNLSKNKTAYNYLLNRGITLDLIEKFQLGYAPSSKELLDFLRKNFIKFDLAKEYGIIDFDENRAYSRFIERITFPIFMHSSIVGFGGRSLKDSVAKYVNSPQTKYFNKSRLLYGYNFAINDIYKKKEIIITEGYIDVILLHKVGFTNSVATLGTALTNDHIPLIKKTEAKVILAYDGDNAGIKAALKASEILAINKIDGGVVLFENGQDPADLVSQNKVDILVKTLKNQKRFIPFILDNIISNYNINIPEEKLKAKEEAKRFLLKLDDVLKLEYQKYLSSILGIDINLGLRKIYKENNQYYNIGLAELEIIKSILEDNELLDIVIDVLSLDMFVYHKDKMELLLDNKFEELDAILLDENIKFYTKENIKDQLLIFLKKYYLQKIQEVKNKNLDFNEKSLLIRKYRKYIDDILKGKFPEDII